MKKKLLTLACLAAALAARSQTLAECQQAAERNYPLIGQYNLVERTTELTLANIQKGWLPQLAGSAQATLQSDVATWPEQMQQIYQQMGVQLKGLRRDQYRMGIDVNQPIYDGGAISSQKAIAREQGNLQVAQTEATMYSVRRRVNEMYFAVLMLDEQIRLNTDLQQLLEGSERKLESMVRGGTASRSDWQNVKAERLKAVQQAANLDAQRRTLLTVLSAFCGIEVKAVSKPETPQSTAEAAGADGGALRPEMRVFDARCRLADAQERALDAALKPRLGVFAQGYYGYPGYNMFEDMLAHKWSMNGMIGARLTWNIGALYTRRNDKARIQLQRDLVETDRQTFLFNNRLEQIQQNENIDRYRRLMTNDEEIIQLRADVRKAAESKLAHGIIDANDLVREINQENAARVQRSVHEIEMLKEMYDLKYTTNK